MLLMLLMMSNLTIMTMMLILMMIRPGEGGTFCWLADQLAGWLPGRPGQCHLVRTKGECQAVAQALAQSLAQAPKVIL